MDPNFQIAPVLNGKGILILGRAGSGIEQITCLLPTYRCSDLDMNFHICLGQGRGGLPPCVMCLFILLGKVRTQTWNLSKNLHDQIFRRKNFTH